MAKKKKKNQELVKAAPVPMKKVEHKGYTVVQSPRNHHIMIGKDGKMVYHAHYDHQLTEDELKQRVDDYLALAERLGMPR